MTELKEEQEDHQQQQQQRLCDFCGEVTALLYCRADSAKLCFSCDREVHSTNQLFTKHTRWLLCDLCDTSPASILCVTDNSVLCQNCDWESHNNHTTVHERRPVEGFTGCPSVSELLSILGFEDLSKKSLLYGGDTVGSDDGYGFSDWLVWDTPSVVSLDDLIAPNDSAHNFPAIGVPPLPKNRNAACGKHKEEILRQLRELSKLEPGSGDDQDETVPIREFQSMEPGKNRQLGIKGSGFMQNPDQTSEAHIVPSSEGSAFHWCSDAGEFADQGFSSSIADCFIETKCLHPDRDSDVGDTSGGATEEQSHNPPTETFQMLPKVAYRELNSQERETAVSRYKEKKKTRRYEKHIRYQSRKVRAESRTRIKGRFAKMDYRDSPMHQ